MFHNYNSLKELEYIFSLLGHPPEFPIFYPRLKIFHLEPSPLSLKNHVTEFPRFSEVKRLQEVHFIGFWPRP
jgi:hypothetical protein